MCTLKGVSFPYKVPHEWIKHFFNQIYQNKDCLKLPYFKLSVDFSPRRNSRYLWNHSNLTHEISQLLIKITQNTSINAISVDGVKFSDKDVEFFNFWFTPPFGEASINKKRNQIVLVRYLHDLYYTFM